MGDRGLSFFGAGAVRSVRRDGTAQTTARIREMVDGIEEALRDHDDLALSRFLAPPLLGRMMAAVAAIGAEGGSLNPARSGLRWTESKRKPGGPGRCWLRLRFEDLTTCPYPEGSLSAPSRTHDLEVEIETAVTPWRLWRILEVLDQ